MLLHLNTEALMTTNPFVNFVISASLHHRGHDNEANEAPDGTKPYILESFRPTSTMTPIHGPCPCHVLPYTCFALKRPLSMPKQPNIIAVILKL